MARSGLAEYLIGRYTAWKTNREPLQTRWQNALNAMKREDPVDRKTFKKGEGEEWRSSDYVGLTKSKVLTVFSILVETLIAQGKIPFTLEPSPYQRDFMQGQEAEALDAHIDKMEDKIREQHSQRKADRQAMLKLLSDLIYGMCVSKYNIEPVERTGFRPIEMQGIAPEVTPYMGMDAIRFQEFTEKDNVPGHIYVSVWNMFWDTESRGNFQTNDGYCERQLISVQEVRAKKGLPFYIDDAIDRVVSQKKADTTVEDADSLPPGLREVKDRKKTIKNLEFWCKAPKPLVEQCLDAAKQGGYQDITIDYAGNELDADEVEILAELADDEVIRLAINDSGKRPHRDCYWEVMLDEAEGQGVPDNMEGIQYLFNGILRSGLDNYKLSANVILALKSRFFEDPAQLDQPIKPGMRFDLSDSCDDARKAMQQVVIQDISQSAMPWLQQLWAIKDTISNVPDILQGTIGPQQKGDTAYEWSQRLDFGSKYIGLGIRNYDEMMIEPEVMDLYVYNMRDPNFQGGKGDYIVHANGFASFQDKLIKTQKLKEMLGLMLASEALGVWIKVRPHIEQIYRNLDLDPEEFLKTEEEYQQEQQAMAEQQAQEMQAQAAMQQQQDQAKLQQEVVKGKIKQDEKEQDFQRDIVKEGIKQLTGGNKKTEKK